MFAEVGYERATIRAIAAAADVDKSSVIQHFGTKQELFREAVHWDIPLAEIIADDPTTTTDTTDGTRPNLCLDCVLANILDEQPGGECQTLADMCM